MTKKKHEPRRFLIVGPPGAGKGTQAVLIAGAFHIPAISTGDIFRKNISERTPLGVQVKEILDRGELVSDELTNAIVADRLLADDASAGFLLDGYPRNLSQVDALDEMLASQSTQLDSVILLEVDTEAVVQRLLKRAEIEGRADDTEEVIRHRQDVYAEQTAPLIHVFGERGILLRIDGMGSVEDVSERILSAVSPAGNE